MSALNYVAQLKEGLAFIRADRVVLAMLLTSALGAVLAEPLYSVVLPVYARQVYGSAVDLGLLFSALGAGSILGNIIFAIFGHRLPRFGTFLVGYGVRALSFWILIGLPSLPILALCIIINATALEPANPLYMTIMQERVPPSCAGASSGPPCRSAPARCRWGWWPTASCWKASACATRSGCWPPSTCSCRSASCCCPPGALLVQRVPARGAELESAAAEERERSLATIAAW